MQFRSRKCCDFEVISTIVICLILVSPVHLFPRPRAKHLDNGDKLSKNSTINTLNSKIIDASVEKNIKKPVFEYNDADNYRSARYIKSEKTTIGQIKNSDESARQLNIPFMAVPSNWIATFEPSNAVILTNKVPLRVWAIGSVAKFPSFLEKIVQRIQSYYSTYKYQDLSRPATQGIISQQYHQHDPENIVTNDSTEVTETIDSISSDPVEDDDFTEMDTDTPFPDYFDTTTDMSYIELDESTETGIEITS